MFNKKSLFKKIAVLGFATLASGMMYTRVMAATYSDINNTDYDIIKKVIETDAGTMVEGSVEPYWLAPGPMVRYPAEGGKWEYGFWNAKVRSYYTVNRCHGSTVRLNGKESRSIDTASGKQSIAELWAIQSDSNDKYYYRTC